MKGHGKTQDWISVVASYIVKKIHPIYDI